MAEKALPTTKKLEIIDKKEFAAAVLNSDDKSFVVHIAALAEPTTMLIHLSCPAQVTTLTSEETGILIEYFDFSNNFFLNSAAELLEHTGIHDYSINLLDSKQPPYGLIYSLRSIELVILKNYIETNLASGFIKPSKSPAGALILFV